VGAFRGAEDSARGGEMNADARGWHWSSSVSSGTRYPEPSRD
jgi:hypothetical protein